MCDAIFLREWIANASLKGYISPCRRCFRRSQMSGRFVSASSEYYGQSILSVLVRGPTPYALLYDVSTRKYRNIVDRSGDRYIPLVVDQICNLEGNVPDRISRSGDP